MSLLKLSRYSYWIFAVLGGLFLLQYWALFIIKYTNGDPWSHRNYWNADVGTYLVLAILLVATPAYLFVLWRNWPNRWRGISIEKVDQ